MHSVKARVSTKTRMTDIVTAFKTPTVMYGRESLTNSTTEKKKKEERTTSKYTVYMYGTVTMELPHITNV
jgi:hypothetical protein